MTAIAESAAAPITASRRSQNPVVLAVLHPKGGVGRSTTVYMLGAELALRGRRVALVDRDQGQHLTRIWQLYPPGILGLDLGDRDDVDVRLIDTAPERRTSPWFPSKGPKPAACWRCRCSWNGSTRRRARSARLRAA